MILETCYSKLRLYVGTSVIDDIGEEVVVMV